MEPMKDQTAKHQAARSGQPDKAVGEKRAALDRCLPQRLSKLTIAVILLIFSLGLVVLGLTILPVIGFILAVPVLLFSIFFFRVHLNQRCEIERGDLPSS